jgi:acyl-lipid omega-6 desaturase (Delta-12 desaturase)
MSKSLTGNGFKWATPARGAGALRSVGAKARPRTFRLLETMSEPKSVPAAWQRMVERYHTPSTRAAVWQLTSTTVLLAVNFGLMYWALSVSYWLVLLLALPAGGLLVRTFIFMHDCGHGSFFRSRRWNDIVGFWTGVLTLTPYAHWRREHAIHHAGSGDLDRRGFGDVTTLTVKEYLALSRWGRFQYRLYRNPLVLLVIGPAWLMIKHRFARRDQPFGPRERRNVFLTNLALLGVALAAAVFGVFKEVALIYLPAMLFAGTAGVWLFYVQHQFEDTYWRPHGEWQYEVAALHGSTYLRLPKVLQWFTGNIGLHHVHHLSPRIPNYRLQQCHDEHPAFQQVPTIGILQGVRSLWLKLWDEDRQRLVGFGYLRRLRQERAAA